MFGMLNKHLREGAVMSQKRHICKFCKFLKGHLGYTVNLKSGGLYQLKMRKLKVLGHTLQRCHLVI